MAEYKLSDIDINYMKKTTFDSRTPTEREINFVESSVVIEAWKSADGNLWYRKWSDGWIEQGGRSGNGTDGGSLTVNYPTPFSGIQYNILVTSEYGSKTNDGYNYYSNLTTTSAQIIKCSYNISWYACGF